MESPLLAAEARQRTSIKHAPQLQRFVLSGVRSTGRQLGCGSYGSVEELEVEGLLCAGKKLHDSLVERGNAGVENIAKKFVEECTLLSDLHHPHIVQSLGICFLPGSNLPVLVMEYLPYCLDNVLESKEDIIPLGIKHCILCDVVRGLTYLHTRSPPVIHRDLTAKNVLMNSAMMAKIADLGVARIVNLRPGQMQATMTQTPGTLSYMPPESLEENPKYNSSIDMFSFGHLSLYTIVNEFPLPTAPTRIDTNDPSKVVGLTEIERRSRQIEKLLEIMGGKEHPMVQLVTLCLQNDSKQRPSARQALLQLQVMKDRTEDEYERMSRLELIRAVKGNVKVQGKDGGRESEKLKAQVMQLQVELAIIKAASEKLKIEVRLHESQSVRYIGKVNQYHSTLQQKQQVETQLRADLQQKQNRIEELEKELQKQDEIQNHGLGIQNGSSTPKPPPLLSLIPRMGSDRAGHGWGTESVSDRRPKSPIPSLSAPRMGSDRAGHGWGTESVSDRRPKSPIPSLSAQRMGSEQAVHGWGTESVSGRRPKSPVPSLPAPRMGSEQPVREASRPKSPHLYCNVSLVPRKTPPPSPPPFEPPSEPILYLRWPAPDKYAYWSKSRSLDRDTTDQPMGDSKPTIRKRSESETPPYDPNLVCPNCSLQFRHGEIQKFRRHVADNCKV